MVLHAHATYVYVRTSHIFFLFGHASNKPTLLGPSSCPSGEDRGGRHVVQYGNDHSLSERALRAFYRARLGASLATYAAPNLAPAAAALPYALEVPLGLNSNGRGLSEVTWQGLNTLRPEPLAKGLSQTPTSLSQRSLLNLELYTDCRRELLPSSRCIGLLASSPPCPTSFPPAG